MIRFITRRLAFAVALLLASSAALEAQFGFATGNPSSTARLVASHKAIASGAKIALALSLEHPDGWHSYYRNSGGVELPPAIEWELPEGFRAGPIRWPVPEVKDGFFGKSFVHEGNPVFLVDLTVPASLQAGQTATLKAKATWQICKETCINEERSFTLDLPVAATAEEDPAARPLFARAAASLPAIRSDWTFNARSEGDDIVLRVKPAGALENDPVDFVPDQRFVLSAGAGGGIRRDGDAWVIRLKRATRDALDNEIPQGDAFSGVLLGPQPVAVPLVRIAEPPPAPLPWSKFLPILGGMLLGGLILNLMPCVFPVIGLKIMGFVQQAGADRRKVVLHGVVFAFGVLASFAVLSGVLFAARSATGGGEVGWGYQLQNPWVVLPLMLLMFVLALNMAGVFEIGASATSVGGSLQSKQGLAGSFFSGVLATVVATPCSAPFLGAAIGAAIALPAVQFFSAFGFMAVGLALPYLVLSAFPRLIAFLPRPGPWMESFKQAMSFLLFATAGYLLWVYGGLIDFENLLGPLFGLCGIAVAAWIHGRWNLPHRTRRGRAAALVFAAAFAAGGVFLAKPPKPSLLDWHPWSPAAQQAALDAGKPVYIDFTAKWCATCQVNKQRAYTPEVVELMRDKEVVAFKADKTKPNPEIEEALREYGRTAIPVNVLLAPGQPPVILPELLSPEIVRKALEGL